MLALEIPQDVIVSVEYFGLARQSDAAEMQKDYLRQALGFIAPNSDFADTSENSESAKSFGIFVRCLQCGMQPDDQPLAIKSVEHSSRLSSTQHGGARYTVRILTRKRSTQFWNIEVGQKKVSWFAVLKKETITASTRLSAKNFEIRSCFTGINCPKTRLFDNQTLCQKEMDRHKGKRINRAASESFQGHLKQIYISNIVHENDVRSQSYVRANYQSQDSSLSIRMNVKALKSGSFGEIIPVEVRNPSVSTRSTRQFDARITGEGEVEIVR